MSEGRTPYFTAERLLDAEQQKTGYKVQTILSRVDKAKELMQFAQTEGWNEETFWGAVHLLHSMGVADHQIHIENIENNMHLLLKNVLNLNETQKELVQAGIIQKQTSKGVSNT
ncbi:hypothetical protein ACFCP7_10490 [Paenibacillus elgii]